LTPPDVLSQSEIDSLLSALTSGAVDLDTMTQETGEYKIKVYDFKRPDKFSKDQLRAIQMIHEAFARQLSTVMSTLIRSIVAAEVASVDQMAYEEFLNSLVQPTVIGTLEMYPFNGNALIEVNPNLVFAMIDRLLGGKGDFAGKARELTDIEKTVIERVLMRMLELLEDSWSTVVDVRFRFESMESNPFFVQVCPPRDMILLVIMKLQVGEVEGMISLCIPYFLMEPIIDKLSSQQWFVSTSRKNSESTREHLLKSLERVKIPMSLELGHTVLSLADVYGLEPGDVVRLDETVGSDIEVRVGNYVRFKAKPGTMEGRLAAEVTAVIHGNEGGSEGEGN
jgi:flagellar motor switch protein FliM